MASHSRFLTAGRSPEGPGPAGQFRKLTVGNTDLLPSEAPWTWDDHLGPPLALHGLDGTHSGCSRLRPTLTSLSASAPPVSPQPSPCPRCWTGSWMATRPPELRSFEPWPLPPGPAGTPRQGTQPSWDLVVSIGCTQRPSSPWRPRGCPCLRVCIHILSL